MTTSNIQYRLEGKRALVTGAASGIGLGTATLLARSGAAVAINDLAGDRLHEVVATLKGDGLNVIAVPGSVGDGEAGSLALVNEAVSKLGGLDYLVNNAATPNTKRVIPPRELDKLTEEFWQKILSVNLTSVFWMTKAAAPALKESRGAVVNTVSTSAFGGGGSSSAYSVGKAGLAGMIRELARALAPEIRVNGIAPGAVNSNWDCDFGEHDLSAVPLHRVGEPEDYADAIVFLCAGAAYVTGEILVVDGGVMA